MSSLHDLRAPGRGPSVAQVLVLVLEGDVVLSQGGCDVRARQDDLLLFDDRSPFTARSSARSLLAAAHVDGARLAPRPEATAGPLPRHIDGRAPLGALVASIVRTVLSLQHHVDERALRRLGAAVLDMLALSVTSPEPRSRAIGPDRPGLLTDIVHYMRAHMADQRLGPDSVADAFRIAPRTLSRLFAADGTTFMRALWQIRLTTAHTGLQDGRFASVTDAALICGFSNPAHFSRTFKEAFGYAPIVLKLKRRPRT
ncbi:helix-turn-helix transcriptional regulator [Methylobacterium sp. Leaf118]|uniref:helix-turn-helix transcriptional regulator n=1 Tax=Methylobacterium sp. Leaf118 TaxID=2876562 RepID=UPI001E36F3A1|nr:AraC family transcriptional regulator [Methylobacterium sp. Leaf118]